MRYRLRALMIVLLVVASYFGGRVSMMPRMKELEQRIESQDARIKKLKSDVDWFHEKLAEDAIEAAKMVRGLPETSN